MLSSSRVPVAGGDAAQDKHGDAPDITITSESAHDVTITLVTPTTPTAQITCLMRALTPSWHSKTVSTTGPFGEKFGEDRFAHYFLPAEQRAAAMLPGFKDKVIAQFNKVIPGVYNMMWSRTRVIDSELSRAIADEARPLQQLVLLGAGYDTRSYRFRQALDARGVRRFEVDLPVLQAAKRAAMEEVVRGEGDIGLDQVTFVSLDLSRPKEELLSSMHGHGFDSHQTSVFIWEGVILYLTRAAVVSSLAFTARGCAPGSLLIATFETPECLAAMEAGPHIEWGRTEPRQFFPPVVEFTQMLRDAGWAVERLYTPDQITANYLMPDEGKAFTGVHVVAARRV